jgi:NADPH:quinone reductase-like Zn-dependent oxidoreductase
MTPERIDEMRAVVQRRYGNSDALSVAQVPRPTAAPDEVLVEVAAAGVDRGTWHLMTGLPRLLRLMFGLRGPKQPIPGLDVAGRVIAIGEQVTRFAEGDEVFGIATGSFAEYAVAKEHKLSHRPPEVSVRSAAVATISGCTALEALVDLAEVKRGQTVLVMGATGGVGSFAVQIAKALGATVTGVGSKAKLDLASDLGADSTIDYHTSDPLDGTVRYDVIIDTGGRRSLAELRRALNPKGTLVIVGGEGGGPWTGGFGRHFRAPVLSLFVRQKLRAVDVTEHHDVSDRLAELMASGDVTPAIGGIYDLEEAGAALDDLAAGRISGKALIALKPESPRQP